MSDVKRYAILSPQGLLYAEAATLAKALARADDLSGCVYDRKTGAAQCPKCRLASDRSTHRSKHEHWDDDVSGYRTPEEVLAFMQEVAAL